jgi:hypothetical protein
LSRPGKPADGQHWMYRVDGRRKCWFPVAADTLAAKKAVRRYAATRRVGDDQLSKDAPSKGEAVENARAELLRAAPTLQPPPPAPADKAVYVVDAASSPATGAAALVPPPPALSKADQPRGDDSIPRPRDVETLLAATPADSDVAAVSVSAAAAVTDPAVETGERQWWTAQWIGPLLMSLGGLMLLLSWRRPREGAVPDAEGLWPAEWEDRPPLRLDFDSQERPREQHAQAAPHPAPPRPRQRTEDRSMSTRPRRQSRQELTFHEAINALTDLDPVSADCRSAALPSRRL